MGFLTTLLLGPAAGLVGSLLSNLFGGIGAYFKRKQDLEAQQLKQDHETKLLEMNIAARGQEMESEQLIAQADAMAQMLSASYRHDASYGPVSTAAAAWLRAVRPVLTFTLVLLTGAIFFYSSNTASITIGVEVMTVHDKIITSVLLMTEIAVSWWFADRRMKKDA